MVDDFDTALMDDRVLYITMGFTHCNRPIIEYCIAPCIEQVIAASIGLRIALIDLITTKLCLQVIAPFPALKSVENRKIAAEI